LHIETSAGSSPERLRSAQTQVQPLRAEKTALDVMFHIVYILSRFMIAGPLYRYIEVSLVRLVAGYIKNVREEGGLAG